MTLNPDLLLTLLLSWKYLAFLVLVLAGWALLARGRGMRGRRLLLQGVAVLVLGGGLGLVLPWAARAFGLHPSPMCAFNKGFGIAVVHGKLGHPMLLFLGAAILLALVGAKGFCGWACPLGALQELVGRIPGLRRYRAPFWLTNGLRILAVAVFFAVLFAAGRMAYDWFNPFEFFHWSHLGEAAVWGPMAAVLAASLFLYRPFCSAVCPIGLVTWLVERVSLGRIRVGESCNDCGVCVAKTDCQAMPALVAGRAVVPDCHGCGDCLDTCAKDAIHFGWKQRA